MDLSPPTAPPARPIEKPDDNHRKPKLESFTSAFVWRRWPERQQTVPAISPSSEFSIDDKLLRDDVLRNENKGRTTMAKAGLYALGFVLLCGVLLIGAGFVSRDLEHDQPKPLPAPVS
jgi:hypothetical protein